VLIIAIPTARRTSARSTRAGWLLVGLIVLISTVIIALASVTFFLTAHLRTTSLRQNQTKAIYLAQAGVMQAIYDFRFDDSLIAGTDTGFRLGEYRADTGAFGPIGSFPSNNVFILGGQAADFLLAAMIPTTFSTPAAPGGCGGGTRHRLDTWTLRNVLLSNTSPDGMPLSFNQMAVSWFPVVGGEGVIRVDLNGTSLDWPSSGCTPAVSGTTVTLNATQTVSPNTLWGTNRIWFATTNMNTKTWIELAFFMSDGSTRRARYVPGSPLTSSASFTVKSVGEVRQGPFPFSVWRRLQAEYRLNDDDANVSNLQEIGNITSDTALLISPAAPVASQRPGYQELNQRSP